MPEEVEFNQKYNHQTEVYFVGKLFERLIENYSNNFKFIHIIKKMVKVNPNKRYESFIEVSKEISTGILGEINFTQKEKEIYRNFANQLSNHINYYIDKYNPINDLNFTLSELDKLIRNSILEEHVQDNTGLIGCFISGGYNYKSQNDIEVDCIKKFYQLIIQLLKNKKLY